MWHAVAINKKVYGTKTIGKDPTTAQIKLIKAQFEAEQAADGITEKAQPLLNAHPYDVILDWIINPHHRYSISGIQIDVNELYGGVRLTR